MAFYDRLPLELKESVAKWVGTEERLEFLQVNKELRALILSRGAFSRNVFEFQMVTYGDPISNESNGMEDLKWNDFAIFLKTDRSVYAFRPYKYRLDAALRITGSSCRFFQMIPSCVAFSFFNCSINARPMLNESFSPLEFLPTNRNCQRLTIGTEYRSVMNRVLNRTLSKITPDTLLYGFVEDDLEAVDIPLLDAQINLIERVGILEKGELKQFLDRRRNYKLQLYADEIAAMVAKQENSKREVRDFFQAHYSICFTLIGLYYLVQFLPDSIQIYTSAFVFLLFSIYISAAGRKVIEQLLRLPLYRNWPWWLPGVCVFAVIGPFVLLLPNLDRSIRNYVLGIGLSIMCLCLLMGCRFLAVCSPVASQFVAKLWRRRKPLLALILFALLSIGAFIVILLTVEPPFDVLPLFLFLWVFILGCFQWIPSIFDMCPNLVSLVPN